MSNWYRFYGIVLDITFLIMGVVFQNPLFPIAGIFAMLLCFNLAETIESKKAVKKNGKR